MQSKALCGESSLDHLLAFKTGREKILHQYAVLPVASTS